MYALQATQLSKQYKNHAALNNLNLTVNKGEIFCLLGQNGAGKTTTLNIFLGFIPASGGLASINGVAVSPNNNDTKKIHCLYTRGGDVVWTAYRAGKPRLLQPPRRFQVQKEQLQELLQKAGLQAEAFSKRVSTYSKGMRQKVGIAIALAKDADVIFMDEPTSGLDPKATNEFTAIVQQLGKQGKAVLMATHDIFNAVNVATTIGIMKQGQLVHVLSANDIDAHKLQQLYLETI
ncbi:ATP-binding cassette domain-containing protein [Paraflavitalea speifideaquila]|uniref:ABC transporter ATP-binding protein n=1 Tax=Paraflavitalea speifideaquila TaxID=3076558 RepID=UPI0028E372C2|nr:ATP-binding cassette domain-containing protein [Paraflavitalea speifideiaquila]